MRQRFFGFVITLLGVGGMAPIGKEFLKVLFWDRVLHFMNPYIAIPLGFVLEHALPLAVAGVGLYLLVGPEKQHAIRYWARTKLNWYLVAAGVLAAGAVGALLLYWADYSRGPMRWVLDSPGSPINFWRRADGPLWVSGFNVGGHNSSEYPVPIKAAFIRSDMSGQTIPLVFGVVGGELLASDATIEPNANVVLHGRYPVEGADNQNPITLDRFRREFGRFTFVFEYMDGRKFIKSFSPAEVDGLIAKAESEQARLLQRPPNVVRRKKD